MHHLKMPDSLARLGVECDETVRKQVVTRTVSTVVRSGGRRERHIDIAQLEVGTETAPRTEVARRRQRAVAPGLGPKFTWPRHDVERPSELTRANIVATDVLGEAALPADAAIARTINRTRHHHHIADDNRARAAVRDSGPGRGQVDTSAIPEPGNRPA